MCILCNILGVTAVIIIIGGFLGLPTLAGFMFGHILATAQIMFSGIIEG
jgi:hypothetical protein